MNWSEGEQVMQKVGCHVSIAGGIINAPQRASDLGCEVFQMFSRSPQGGPAPKITPEIIKQFKEEMKKWGQENCYIHAPYYINFASSNKTIRSASARVVREELERGSLIGAKYVMFHPGSAKDMDRKEAIKITAEGVAKVMDGYIGSTATRERSERSSGRMTELLLEVSAGAGNVMGDTFEELSEIIKLSGFDLGICLDSAHIFASGYDIKTKDGFKKTIENIKKTVGLKKIKLIHSNDSKIELGGRKDRHDHIGDGKIGLQGFENLMGVFNCDFIAET
ncbi:MAG: deoxyribonuclease IV, partial [Candidatus Taylorbacteria bacterium]|nr:deoxyribonuclease IV [Candidatus Taylorbacteria bacterium]